MAEVLIWIVLALCMPSRDTSFGSAVVDLEIGPPPMPAEDVLVAGCAGIAMVESPLVSVPLGISASAAGIGLPCADGITKAGSATSGLTLRVGLSAWSDVARSGSGGTETGGGPPEAGDTAGATSIAQPAVGADLSAAEEAEDILVAGCAGITTVESALVAVPLRISANATWIGLPSADGVAKGGCETSGRTLRAGRLAWSEVARNRSGGTETGGGPSGMGDPADALPIAEAPSGSNLSLAGETGPEMVPHASPTADSGTGGKNAGNGAVSKIFRLLSGTALAGGSGESELRFAEELGGFVGCFALPLAVTLPWSVSPTAFGFADVSSFPFVASAKAVENFPDGPTPPMDALPGIALTAIAGKLTITVSPQPLTEFARRWPERFELEAVPGRRTS